MEVKVARFMFDKDFTMSRVYVDGEFFSYGLEPFDASINIDTPIDTILELKKNKGKIAIPIGTYDLIFNWSNKYKKKLPLILDTPGFRGVRIHSGNKVEDTLACLLVGKFYKNGWLCESRNTMDKFLKYWEGKEFEKARITYTYADQKMYLY